MRSLCPRQIPASHRIAYFHGLTFQADVASLLRLVEWFGIWRLWAATKSSTVHWEVDPSPETIPGSYTSGCRSGPPAFLRSGTVLKFQSLSTTGFGQASLVSSVRRPGGIANGMVRRLHTRAVGVEKMKLGGIP